MAPYSPGDISPKTYATAKRLSGFPSQAKEERERAEWLAKMPFFLNSQKMPFWLYVPNLVGYVRVATLVLAYMDANPGSSRALWCLVWSLGLDFIDGPLARRLNMCTQFGDILDHVTDHLTMFYLVWITSDCRLNLFLNAVHVVVTLGYMAYYGHYFKHGTGNPITKMIEANNYWNLPATLYAANTFLVPLVKMSYAVDHESLGMTSSTTFVDLVDYSGLLVTTLYTVAVLM